MIKARIVCCLVMAVMWPCVARAAGPRPTGYDSGGIAFAFATEFLNQHRGAPAPPRYVERTFAPYGLIHSGRLARPVDLLRLHGDEHSLAAQLGRFYGLLPRVLDDRGAHSLFVRLQANRGVGSCERCPHASNYVLPEDETALSVVRHALGVSSEWNPLTRASVVRFEPGKHEVWFHVGPIRSVGDPRRLYGGHVQVVLHVDGDDGSHGVARSAIARLLDAGQLSVTESVELVPPLAGMRKVADVASECGACEVLHYAATLATAAAR